jgi:hypothetical protein
MSDVHVVERDAKTGRFQPGNNGGPGRGRGNRARISEAYLADLGAVWEAEGREALLRCAREEPGTFCRLMSQLLPKDVSVDIDVTIRAQTALEAYRVLKELPRGELRELKQIDAVASDE